MSLNESTVVLPELKVEIVPNAKIVDLSYSPARTFTTEEANTRITQLSCGLLNLKNVSNIAVMSLNSYEYMCILLAATKTGKTSIPINIKLPIEQLHYCLRDCAADLIFYTNEFKHLVPDDIRAIEIGSKEYADLLLDDVFQPPVIGEDQVHSIMYTSGTTGNPKGVVTTFGSKRWFNYYSYQQIQDPNDKPTVAIHVSPMYHSAGTNALINSVTTSTSSDLTVVIMPKFNAKEYIKAIETYRPIELRMVSPMMAMILAERELLLKSDLSSVKCIFLTSSAAPEKMQREVKFYFKNVFNLANPYGMTESGPVFGHHPDRIPRPINSVGYPLPGVETRIVDGVLQIKSPAILTAYHNKKEAYDKIMTEDGFLVTGDLFRVNKYGFYFYLGRSDDMFKSGGEKIYPSEIEAIIDKHPAVALSAVVGVADKIKGAKPYAFVQLKPGESITGEKIKDYAIRNLATYQIPREVWVLDALPKTTVGKIDRRLLSKMAEERVALQEQS